MTILQIALYSIRDPMNAYPSWDMIFSPILIKF
uniref:Uncharacterized protein n=1 Tax=Solanum lycopersicum TaxID=4081 RepID=A0A3Q7EKF0_SOLLC